MADVQPPEGLRDDLARRLAARYGEAEVFTDGDPCDEWRRDQYRSDAGHALAALFEACEVREDWGVRGVWPDAVAHDDWRNTRAAAEDVLKARSEMKTDVRSFLIRRCALKAPPEPVSSTGEEPTDG